MTYIESINIFGTEYKINSCIQLTAPPTSSTPALVGMLAMNTNSNEKELYKCVSVNRNTYTWKPLETSGGESGTPSFEIVNSLDEISSPDEFTDYYVKDDNENRYIHYRWGIETGYVVISYTDKEWQEEIEKQSEKFIDWLENGNGKNIEYSIPFYEYSNEQNEIKKNYNFSELTYSEGVDINTTSFIKCPKYLGFKIEGNARLYLYIGDLDDEQNFIIDSKYHINTDFEKVNYLRDIHSRFIEIEEENKYFYYSIEHQADMGNSDQGKVTILGTEHFPVGKSDIIATSPQYVLPKNDDPTKGEIKIEGANYYGIILPSDCFYAILNKTSPEEARTKFNSYEEHPFYVSYEEEGSVSNNRIISITKGASFGYIPRNVGAAIISLPSGCNLNELYIYTDKDVKVSSKTGRKRLVKNIGDTIIKDFYFESQVAIPWNDNANRKMEVGRRFYGVPYSSRWANTHYVGFEITPETAFNALNNPYSIAYDKTENRSEISSSGGPGYGLVCSSFSCLMSGNPYPQSNRGFTFDKNFKIEPTIDINPGELLTNKNFSHCIFVEESYDDGYALYEATDPCVAKTTRTCKASNATYAEDKVQKAFLDDYIYSIVNKNRSGYDVVKKGNNSDRLKLLKNFDVSTFNVPQGDVRPWRGNKSVYGLWDTKGHNWYRSGETFKEGTIKGSGIWVTIHDKNLTSFTLTKTAGNNKGTKEIQINSSQSYVNITDEVAAFGSGSFKISTGDSEKDEYFRFIQHKEVTLCFDENGKAFFKNTTDGTIAADIQYAYVEVQGYGGIYNNLLNSDSQGPMVIAAGSYYPDLAANPKRIIGLRAAIARDIDYSTYVDTEADSWGMYACNMTGAVESAWKNDDTLTKEDLLTLLSNFYIN
jgi:hypothetical protein